MHVARGVVVGIKKVGVLGNFRPIVRHPNFDDEGFKEPARMGEMPFGGTHVRHRLYDVVFWMEMATKPRAEIANAAIALDQELRASGVGRGLDFVLTARCLGHEGLGRFHKKVSLPALTLPCEPPPFGRARLPPARPRPAVGRGFRPPRFAGCDATSTLQRPSI